MTTAPMMPASPETVNAVGIGCSDWLDAIHCADCMEVLAQLPDKSVAATITDPPYAMTQNEWDKLPDLAAWWLQIRRVTTGAVVMTASQPFASKVVMSNLAAFKYEWVWEKSHPSGHLNAKVMPLRQHENVLVFDCGGLTYNPQMHRRRDEDIRPDTQGPNKSSNYGHYETGGGRRTVAPEEGYPRSVVKFSNDIGRRGLHPTQKPIELMRYLVETYTNPCDVVLDCYAGSGTTLVACKQTGRHFIGIEKEQRYADTTKTRLTQEMWLGV
jgi:site-specific DNA-methyltransferase (adenine-specific)